MDVVNFRTIEKEENIILPFEKPAHEIEVEKISDLPPKPVYSFIKRLFDISASAAGIILLCIPMAVICAVICATSAGGPIYKQERLGLNGKKFFIYKFRTMYNNAEDNGAQWSSGSNDKRITPVGRFLRRTKLDELPQLFNCIKGEISIVGPRPERSVFYKYFETYVHGFSQRLLVKPGITGLAQVKGGYFTKPEKKIIYDLEYIKNRSLWVDFKILLLTIVAVIRGEDEK